jgi:hypothetical protein
VWVFILTAYFEMQVFLLIRSILEFFSRKTRELLIKGCMPRIPFCTLRRLGYHFEVPFIDHIQFSSRLGYHFEVPFIDHISFFIDEKCQKMCSLVDIGGHRMIGGKVDKGHFKVVPKPFKWCV